MYAVWIVADDNEIDSIDLTYIDVRIIFCIRYLKI